MKLHGEILELTNIRIVPIIRENKTIFLKVAPISSFEDFLKVCPMPVPPTRDLPGKGPTPFLEAKEYKAQMAARNAQMLEYMIIKSLDATDGLTWDTVDLSNPDTYKNYDAELRAAGFTQIEITRIVSAVMGVNSLDEEAIDRARESFLATPQLPPVQG
jgi:hypothetical protein